MDSSALPKSPGLWRALPASPRACERRPAALGLDPIRGLVVGGCRRSASEARPGPVVVDGTLGCPRPATPTAPRSSGCATKLRTGEVALPKPASGLGRRPRPAASPKVGAPGAKPSAVEPPAPRPRPSSWGPASKCLTGEWPLSMPGTGEAPLPRPASSSGPAGSARRGDRARSSPRLWPTSGAASAGAVARPRSGEEALKKPPAASGPAACKLASAG
mmetsp:Transcript_61751/g.199049  ORF Transcript_61751/g.199049 Transcript_61751/m.199049 type:complete len:218 (-) Transcript_61751:294-947(-)